MALIADQGAPAYRRAQGYPPQYRAAGDMVLACDEIHS
jgi:hypothetical protein